MSRVRGFYVLGVLILLTALGNSSVSAQEIKTVFVIAMENHNWTQPANQFTGKTQQLFQNSNAPFINSLVNGTAFVSVNGSRVQISKQVAYATAYHNVLVTGNGNETETTPIYILPSRTISGPKLVLISACRTTTTPIPGRDPRTRILRCI